MGNRAVIAIDSYSPKSVGIYLHWNGGRDSIEAFLKSTQTIMGDHLGDEIYGTARLIQVISTFLNGSAGVGVGLCENLDCDNHDNGVYIIDPDTMTITDRVFFDNKEEQQAHDIDEMVAGILHKISAGANADIDTD